MAKDFEDMGEVQEVITIVADNGEELDFAELANIEHEGKDYIVLEPLEMIEGLEEGDVLIYEVEADGNFANVEEDEIVDAVFDKFIALLEEEEQDEE